MRSIFKTNKNDYQLSIILEHDTSVDFFHIFALWLKSQQNNDFDKNSLLNNPAFRFINPEGESIKIDDIRNFNQELAFSNYNSDRRFFVFFNADLATISAQNAALKSIEEPPENTQIILMTSTLEKLLPTIISRCEVVSLKKSTQGKNNQDENTADLYKKILTSRHFELIEFANNYKERTEAILFLNKLLSYLNFELNSNNSEFKKKSMANHLRIVLKTMKQLNQNVNVKLAFENCLFELIAV
ncbi:MAG: hypothetical protein COZ34_04630 [Candidatus Pacebacteria bacterium CG_4_10_14_3_um_filter_34_15]|nr:hypothetical protein [Candidatus Pacearchaeota archaeon]NCQ66102.1 hypothetical protein [Candidatus Paceibacterota bacterium]OIO43982.1 MAG: hypothetical protein AUJ41_04005 [Candidatus Pacebacteria bacterium CG1_02_43_31]PIQ81202.1 MAG: hypothetical protein COV78_01580 [Candidatus Pacebacteria bacterium CG11_big_fil_rev_8_21_14_0_20_34_55]PIX81182.1 MAG: hypothetical protein COZ34_04630 [Candidatus Pacebacteria bacterium CG_4_10_14_3_um_filter_34_15]PJC43518.1 MAG: hypothetical protein CO0